MKVAEIMNKNVCLARPDQTIREAAQMMQVEDVGLLPVGENDRLVGMLTDRDIAVRVVAEGKSPDARIRDVMTSGIKYCFEDEDVDHVAENMSEIQVRRLPVLNRHKELVGIVSLADFARSGGTRQHVGHALGGITEPNR